MSRRPPIWGIDFKNGKNNQHPPKTTNSDSNIGDTGIELDDVQNHIQEATQHPERDGMFDRNVHSMHRHKDIRATSNLRHAFEARTGLRPTGYAEPLLQSATGVMENHASRIVDKMEQDPDLMEDSPISENLRRQALRDMPQCLTIKRHVKVKLSKSVSKKSKNKPIGCWKQFKYRNSMMFTKFFGSFKNVLSTMELWYSSLKKIEGNFGSGIGSFFKFLRFMFIVNLLLTLVSFMFIVLPQIVYNSHYDIKNPENFTWYDLITGEGYMKTSTLFYGSYSSVPIEFSLLTYGIPEAYFFTMMFLYLVCLAVFGYSVAVSYRRSFIETEGGLKNVYANKIFCGWDYSIATQSAATLKSRAIYNELKELLHDSMTQKPFPTCLERFSTIMLQFMTHLIVFLSYCGIGSLIWFLMKESDEENWSPLYTALAINVVMNICPAIFSGIVIYEGYNSAKTKLKITLFRVFVLGAVIIGVLMTFRLKQTDGCWETSLGQEVYRLMIIDLIFCVVISPIFDLITYGILRTFDIGFLHFDISRHTMQIIYNQALFWVGFMFSPLLPVISMIKLFLMWYVHEIVLMKLCKPSLKSWRAARTSTWFLMMAFLSLLIVLGLLVYILSYVPSSQCGPFQNYSHMLELLTEGIFKLKTYSKTFKYLLLFTKPGFIAILLIALCCWVYYVRGRALAQRNLVAIYRNMLVWEGRDREYLLQQIRAISKGWKYDGRMTRDVDPIMFAPTVNNENIDSEVSLDSTSSASGSTYSRRFKKYQ